MKSKKVGSRYWVVGTAAFLGAVAAGIAYSAFGVDHHRRLDPAVPGETSDLFTAGGRVTLYGRREGEGPPLLLIHSINAAASAYEMRPLFQYYLGLRPVYAIDLPGYGLSERRKQTYTPRIMIDAIHAAVAQIRQWHGGAKIDLLALSVSCEYAARAAFEKPDTIRTLGLISPTGFDKALSGYGRPQSTKGNSFTEALISFPLWSQALFDLVSSRASMRFFLKKTFGSSQIDEDLLTYDQASSHQPGATHVVWSFLAGYLFADDVTRIYESLSLPIWTVHGRKGDFVDYGKETAVAGKSNWNFDEFDTGAMPQFQRLSEVVASYERFQNKLDREH